MLKGLALTPPVVGRISIGKVVEKNGKRLPEKDDEFRITSQVQALGGWIPHPIDEELRANAKGKLRSIPVRLMFDDPDLNLRACYCMFDRTSGRPLCVGDGAKCKRVTAAGIQQLPCPAPEGCELAQGGACKPYGRMNVRIGDEDEFGSFIFRTTGFNSIRTLATRLRYFHAASAGALASLPLELRLRGKSTTLSLRTPIYYVDLVTRVGMSLAQSVQEARRSRDEQQVTGIDQAAVDAAAHAGLSRGAFEESAEEGEAIVEEFFPNESAGPTATGAPLAEKLARKAQALVSGTEPASRAEAATRPRRTSSDGQQ